ncbi:MAG: histidine phosphatase family protein [Anaerolineales bacterium]
MTTVLLIRHGLNDFVDTGKLAGHLPDVHLNDKGKAQAAALAANLKDMKLKAVYSSPLDRTMETAEPIAEAQGLKIQPKLGLGEVDVGRWQGRTLKSLQKLKYWSVIQNTPSLARFPEGESFPEAQARIVLEIEALRQEHSGKKDAIVCVSHSDMIKLAVAHYLGLPLDLFQKLVVQPASVSILSVGKNHIRLVRLNDTHLSRPAEPE